MQDGVSQDRKREKKVMVVWVLFFLNVDLISILVCTLSHVPTFPAFSPCEVSKACGPRGTPLSPLSWDERLDELMKYKTEHCHSVPQWFIGQMGDQTTRSVQERQNL